MRTLICLILLVVNPVQAKAMGLIPKLLIGGAIVGTTVYLINKANEPAPTQAYAPPKALIPQTFTLTLSGSTSLEKVEAVNSWNDACIRFSNSIQSQYPGRVISVSCGAPTVQASQNPRSVGIYADPLYTKISTGTYTVLM